MKRKYKDINKIIAKEAKLISKKYSLQDDNLTIKFSASEVKSAIKYDTVEKKPIARFKNDFVSTLAQMNAIGLTEAEHIELEFDSKTDPVCLKAFVKAWKEYFAFKIYKKNQDIKIIWKKNIVSLVLGLIALAVVVAFGIAGVYSESKGFKVATVCVDAIFSILSWVFIWEFFYDVVYTLGAERVKMICYYKMYKANLFEDVDPTTKPQIPTQVK